MKFTFNKKARAMALSAIKRLESGAFASSVLGAFSTNPKVTAISALVLFLVCRVSETVIAGIEDDEDIPSASKVPRIESSKRKKDLVDSG